MYNIYLILLLDDTKSCICGFQFVENMYMLRFLNFVSVIVLKIGNVIWEHL